MSNKVKNVVEDKGSAPAEVETPQPEVNKLDVATEEINELMTKNKKLEYDNSRLYAGNVELSRRLSGIFDYIRLVQKDLDNQVANNGNK